MTPNTISCFKYVDEYTKCLKCDSYRVKNGKTLGGKQRYFCSQCKSSKVLFPQAIGFGDKFNQQVAQLCKEGCGIRSIARILNISPSSVLRILLRIAISIEDPVVDSRNLKAQVDELHTFIRHKKKVVYVIYSWISTQKKAESLVVGTRSKVNLRLVINPLLENGIEKINTDRYSGYIGVVPKKKHTTYTKHKIMALNVKI